MANLIYLPTAVRACVDCDRTKAVPELVARRHALLCATPTESCARCGDRVEVACEPLAGAPNAGYNYSCDDCGASEPGMARTEIDLPDGMGVGWIRLCGSCIARYDEGDAAWAQ